jgi:hypothetical protein
MCAHSRNTDGGDLVYGIGDRAGAADQVVLILNQTTDAVSVIEKYL